MNRILIQGQHKLFGQIEISGAKNAALPILAASLLTDDKVELSNMPMISDIVNMIDLIRCYGANVTDDGLGKVVVSGTKMSADPTATDHLMNKMRASIWVLAPVLARHGKAKMMLPGGCLIGDRGIDLHIEVLKALGAEFEFVDNYLIARSSARFKAIDFTFRKISVGATITGILAASIASGNSCLRGCAIEPEIIDMCRLLNKMGAKITISDNREIHIQGVAELRGAEHRIVFDRLEAGTYLMAAAITQGRLKLTGIPNWTILSGVCQTLESVGLDIEKQENSLIASYSDPLRAVNVETAPYPGFATDLQAPLMTLLTAAHGSSHITENIFENRFLHARELNKLGANITINGIVASIEGPTPLRGGHVVATDLRAAAALVLAGLTAEGQTYIDEVQHLDRGYCNLISKLNACGAHIQRISKY